VNAQDFAALTLFLVVVLAMGLLGWRLLRAPRTAAEEQGLSPRFTAVCAVSSGNFAIFGHANSYPTRIAIYDDFLVIGSFYPVVIRFSDIDEVGVRSSFLARPRVQIAGSSGYKYLLAVKDAEAVARLIRKREDVESSWVCAACKEKNPMNFELCWNCEAPRATAGLVAGAPERSSRNG